MNLKLNDTLVVSYATALAVALMVFVIGMFAGAIIALVVVFS